MDRLSGFLQRTVQEDANREFITVFRGRVWGKDEWLGYIKDGYRKVRDSREQSGMRNEGEHVGTRKGKPAPASPSLFYCEMGEQRGKLRGRVERGGESSKRNTEGLESTFG